MKDLVDNYFSLIFRIGVAIIILSTLLLFANFTTEFYETPKFIVLLITVGLLLVLTTFRFTMQNKVVLIRTPLDLPLLLLLGVAVVSTIISPAPFVSLLGNQLKISASLVALITYILFYFILTNNLRSVKDISFIVNLSLGAGAVLCLISLIAYSGLTFLSKNWPQGLNFTPTGSTFSETAVLALLIPILVIQLLKTSNLTFLAVNSVLLALFGVVIALTGELSTWATALLGLVGGVLITNPKMELKEIKLYNLIGLVAALIIIGLITALSLIPIPGIQNPIYDKAKAFPREIQLPFVSSWKISVSSFRDSPFWGTGPGTYLFDFTLYKPLEFNSEKFWNIRFDSSFNEYLSLLATLGGVGFLAILSLVGMYFTSQAAVFKRSAPPLELALSISGVLFFVLLFLHSATLVLWIMGLVILALALVIKASEEPKLSSGSYKEGLTQAFLRIVSKTTSIQTSQETIKVETLPAILLVIAVAVILAVFFYGGKFILADHHHRLALNAVTKNDGVVAYNELVAAEKLNPQNDLYRIDLAQTNFALANAIALSKTPTKDAPSGSLTDKDKQNIQILLQQSISEGRFAVSLSPRSAINWEILAALYRQISGVAQNALLFSLDAYGRAIFQDPLNPLLRLNVGGTYYAIKNYDLAIRFFTDAINLKPDFANGFYNLSVALRDKGDLNAALQAAQKVVELVEPNSADYKIATDYLNDLKAKAGGPPAQPPAATTSGELQNEKLPKVVNVGKPPEKIATPTAVKKPNSTPEPTPKP